MEPVNYDPQKRGPNQLEGWNQWVENKAVYALKRDLLMETGCRLGGKIGFVEMSKTDSVDIDTEDDFRLAENILKSRGVDGIPGATTEVLPLRCGFESCSTLS